MGGRAAGNTKQVLTISSARVLHTADEVGSKVGAPSPWKMGDPVPAGLLKETGFRLKPFFKDISTDRTNSTWTYKVNL